METKANYVLIGAFTLLVAAAMLLFGLWAAKYSTDRNWQAYHVVFNEPVTGLTEGGAVQYNGISVGTVDSLSLIRTSQPTGRQLIPYAVPCFAANI